MKTFSIQGAGKVIRDLDKSSCREFDCKSNDQGKCLKNPKPVTSTKNSICSGFSNKPIP